MMWLSTVCLIIAQAAGQPAVATSSPFDRASQAPADVTLYVHLDHLAAIRKDLGDRPIMAWMQTLTAGGQAAEVWTDLAAATGLGPAELFDICFGQCLTLLVRSVDDVSEWVLITDIQPERSSRLLTQLKAVVHAPRFNMAMLELPEHNLLLARSQPGSKLGEGTILIAPKDQPRLFEQVLRRIDTPGDDSLAAGDAVKRAKQIPPGRVGVYKRHDAPIGGWSVAVADLADNKLKVRHFGSFETSPLSRSVSSVQIDPSPLDAFHDHALLAMIEPMDVDGGPLAGFMRAGLGQELLNAPIRRNLSQRRIVVLGEIEGRQEPEPVDIQATTLAVCVELINPTMGQSQFDRHMINVAKRIDQLGGEAFSINIPCHRSFKPGEPRAIDISPAMQWLGGALPLAGPVTLNWMVVEGQDNGWAVIATHPRHLDDAARALGGASRCDEAKARRTQSCGYANGRRISQHLRSWSDQAELFAKPEKLDEFRTSLRNIAMFADGIDRCLWHLSRPSVNEMCLELTIELAAPDSAGLP